MFKDVYQKTKDTHQNYLKKNLCAANVEQKWSTWIDTAHLIPKCKVWGFVMWLSEENF